MSDCFPSSQFGTAASALLYLSNSKKREKSITHIDRV